MKREEYNACMCKGMTGKKLSKDERKLEFCVVAKTCVNPNMSRDEAASVCKLPKPPKAVKQPKKGAEAAPAVVQQQAPEISSSRKPSDAECNPEVFMEAAKMYKKLYVTVTDEGCTPCDELKRGLQTANVPHPIVSVPAEHCSDIADALGVRAFPTVVLMERGKVKKTYEGNPDNILDKMQKGM